MRARASYQAALDRLSAEIRGCRICRDTPSGKALPHEPRPVFRASATARIVIAGQAPGTRVHQSGNPFTDPSGDRLREWMGVSLREFYDDRFIAIVPMGFCFPGLNTTGGDLPPRVECAPRWRQPLLDALPAVELILAVGQYAHWWHIGGRRRSVTETVKDFSNPERLAEKPFCIALPHPSWRNNAWIRANPWFDEDVVPMVRRHVRRLLEAE